MPTKHGLGRGLSALIRDGSPAQPEDESPAGLRRLPLDRIRPNRLQPRRAPADGALAELTASIREHGVLQPLLVRTCEDGYELIAGERRLRAAGAAGLTEVPVVLMEAADRDALELALVENIQREDLNPVEEAEAYRTLARRFGLTQDQIADRVGKARSSVANALRLLALPDTVRALVADGSLSTGHAKALAALEIPEEQSLLARRAVREDLTVRALERLVRQATRPPRKPRATRDDVPPDHLARLSERLHAHFGTAIRITPTRTYANGKKAKGAIEIEFYSNDDLDRILTLLGLSDEA
ncbi:MAG: ParB/RepB/Spo0J family partition protein [Lentisphaerae bacterium]|nr:ParB/RepB/Spo0J family partition protein [Lentisphaerota bacterium]